jgi:putative membrane protein insertion efficiency factor
VSAVSGRRLSPLSRFAVRYIETYRSRVAHRLATSCPFTPTCSEYGLQAYQTYGFLRATAKTLLRLRRCRPGSTAPRFDPP